MRRLAAACLLSLCLCSTAYAVIPVEEVGLQLERTIWTSIQSTITAVQSVILVADSAMNLVSIGSSALEGLEATIADLNAILMDANGILFDIRRIEHETVALFALETAPASTTELQIRLAQIRRVCQEYLTMARRVQTITASAADILRRLERIWGRVLDIAGNKASGQQVQEALVQLNVQQTAHNAQVAAFQQAMLTQAQTEPLVTESVSRIKTNVRASWPRP